MPGARQVLITRSIDRHEFNTRAIEPQPRAGKGPYVLFVNGVEEKITRTSLANWKCSNECRRTSDITGDVRKRRIIFDGKRESFYSRVPIDF